MRYQQSKVPVVADSDTQLLEQHDPHSNVTAMLFEASSQADVASAQLKPYNSSASDAAAASKPAGIAQGTDVTHEELLLLPNSASSNKARHGGSIYDMLVQEIKSLKLQQKLAPRQLAELQKNMSAYTNKTSADIHALQQSVQLLQSEVEVLKQQKNTTKQSESSESVVAESPDASVEAELDLHAVHRQLEVVKAALHIVQHRVTAIVLMAMVAWLAVMVLTAPDLGRMTWILYVPITMISAIGVLWLAGVLRILPNHFTLQ